MESTSPKSLLDLPTEIIGRIIHCSLEHAPLPILHYPVWESGSMDEPYLQELPIPLAADKREPRLLWDVRSEIPITRLAGFYPPACREPLLWLRAQTQENFWLQTDHDLLDALPRRFHDEYVTQVISQNRMLVMLDLELSVLRDPSRWSQITSPRPLPLDTPCLYIRLQSDDFFRSHKCQGREARDQSKCTCEPDWTLLFDFLSQFTKLEYLAIDIMSVDYPLPEVEHGAFMSGFVHSRPRASDLLTSAWCCFKQAFETRWKKDFARLKVLNLLRCAVVPMLHHDQEHWAVVRQFWPEDAVLSEHGLSVRRAWGIERICTGLRNEGRLQKEECGCCERLVEMVGDFC